MAQFLVKNMLTLSALLGKRRHGASARASRRAKRPRHLAGQVLEVMDDDNGDVPIHVYVTEEGEVLREIPAEVQQTMCDMRDKCVCVNKSDPNFVCMCDMDASEAMLHDNDELSMSEDNEANDDDGSAYEAEDDEYDESSSSDDEDEMTESEDESEDDDEEEGDDDNSDLCETAATDDEEEGYLDDDPDAPENLLP